MPKLFIMFGNIGSGKTTFVKNFVRGHPEIVCVSRDSLRYMIGAGEYIFSPELESVIFDSENYTIQELMKKGCDIIVDEVDICKKYRESYIKLAKKFNYAICVIVLPFLDKKTSVERRMKNNHGSTSSKIWAEVWDKFYTLMEEPTIYEGFDEIISSETIKWD